MERSAYAEAVSHFSAALELILAMPHSPQQAERELAVVLALGPPVQVTKGWSAPEAEAIYLRARELCSEVGETPQLFPALFGLAAYYAVGADFKPAREIMEQFLSLAQRSCDPAMLLQAHHQLSYLWTWIGELRSARHSQDEVMSLYDSKRDHHLARLYGGDDPACCCLGQKSLAMWLLGYPDQAMESVRSAVHLARQLSHPLSITQTISTMATLHALRRERTNAVEQAEATIALSEENGFPLFLQVARLTQSAFASDRSTADGVKRIRRGLEDMPSALSIYLGWLAEACLEASDYAEAGAALAEAFAYIERSGELFWEAELYRLRGELKFADPAAAASDLRRALEVARSQDARSLELRATMSLARLLDKQGNRAEARTILSEIYNWFTEGFDTADLKDAKALLAELNV